MRTTLSRLRWRAGVAWPDGTTRFLFADPHSRPFGRWVNPRSLPCCSLPNLRRPFGSRRTACGGLVSLLDGPGPEGLGDGGGRTPVFGAHHCGLSRTSSGPNSTNRIWQIINSITYRMRQKYLPPVIDGGFCEIRTHAGFLRPGRGSNPVP